jgi:hypothetical protein
MAIVTTVIKHCPIQTTVHYETRKRTQRCRKWNREANENKLSNVRSKLADGKGTDSMQEAMDLSTQTSGEWKT